MKNLYVLLLCFDDNTRMCVETKMDLKNAVENNAGDRDKTVMELSSLIKDRIKSNLVKMKQQWLSTGRSCVYTYLGSGKCSRYGTILVRNFPLISMFLLTVTAIFVATAYGKMNAEKAVKAMAEDIENLETCLG